MSTIFHLNWADFFILAAIAISVLVGLFRGFVRENNKESGNDKVDSKNDDKERGNDLKERMPWKRKRRGRENNISSLYAFS